MSPVLFVAFVALIAGANSISVPDGTLSPRYVLGQKGSVNLSLTTKKSVDGLTLRVGFCNAEFCRVIHLIGFVDEGDRKSACYSLYTNQANNNITLEQFDPDYQHLVPRFNWKSGKKHDITISREPSKDVTKTKVTLSVGTYPFLTTETSPGYDILRVLSKIGDVEISGGVFEEQEIDLATGKAAEIVITPNPESGIRHLHVGICSRVNTKCVAFAFSAIGYVQNDRTPKAAYTVYNTKDYNINNDNSIEYPILDNNYVANLSWCQDCRITVHITRWGTDQNNIQFCVNGVTVAEREGIDARIFSKLKVISTVGPFTEGVFTDNGQACPGKPSSPTPSPRPPTPKPSIPTTKEPEKGGGAAGNIVNLWLTIFALLAGWFSLSRV